MKAGAASTGRRRNCPIRPRQRVFEKGPLPGPVEFRGIRLGVPICEDIWIEDVADCLMETGAELLIVPNGSPYWVNKADLRVQVAVARIVETGLPVIYANQIGGQDELVFDGGSFGLNGDRTLPNYGVFDERRVFKKWPAARTGRISRCAPRPADLRGYLGR